MADELQARPTTYAGIRMRSRLEARFAAFLDRVGLPWEYEPRAFASRRGQYLPDFLVRHAGTLGDVYVEVKGRAPDNPFEILDRMTIIWDSEPSASLACIVAAYARLDRRETMMLVPAGIDRTVPLVFTAEIAAIGVCGCVQARLLTERRVGTGQRHVWCGCGNPTVRGYLDPFS